MRRFLTTLVFLFLVPPSVFCADTDPKLLLKCVRILKKIDVQKTPLIPAEVQQVGTGITRKAKTYTEINRSNIAELFTHQYAPEKDSSLLGAKGIVYRGVDGELKVVFWPTGQETIGNNIHHRDAVASVLQAEVKAMDVVLSDTNNMKVLMLQDALGNLSEQLSQVRSSQSIPDSVAERFSGFQMTAIRDPKTGAYQLKHVDIDSSLTSVQTQRGILQTVEETQNMLDAISRAIDSDLKPESYRLDKSQKQSLTGPEKLHAPAGSRLEILQ